jgi:hypothetical protein
MSIKNISVTKTEKPSPRYRSSRDYDFLQYIRPVFRWALSNNDVNKGELEMLLYLYPKGVFTKSDFFKYQKIISIKQQLVFNSFLERGLIKMWRPKARKESALYSLTHKTKKMCDLMHKVLVGDMDLPELPKNNEIAKGKKVIDNYYMDVIKKMNKENKEIRSKR